MQKTTLNTWYKDLGEAYKSLEKEHQELREKYNYVNDQLETSMEDYSHYSHVVEINLDLIEADNKDLEEENLELKHNTKKLEKICLQFIDSFNETIEPEKDDLWTLLGVEKTLEEQEQDREVK